MHRLILLSAAYQQSSVPTPEAVARDPENRLFSRQNRIRLEGEAIRDSLLAISGRLNRKMGGPSILPPLPADLTEIPQNWMPSTDVADHTRRSLYIFARRNLRFPFLEVFDAPDSNLSCPERGRSTTAPQALTLLNSQEVMEAAAAAAERALRAAPLQDGRIAFAYQLILGSSPTPRELNMSREFVAATLSRQAEEGTAGTSLSTVANPESRVWMELCRALFNLNRFLYVD
jgi:hypothetical protein